MFLPTLTPVFSLVGKKSVYQGLVSLPEESVQGVVRLVEVQTLSGNEPLCLIHGHHDIASVVRAEDQLVVLHRLLGVLIVLVISD